MVITITILFSSIALIVGVLVYSAKTNKRKQQQAIDTALADAAQEYKLEWWSHKEVDGRRAIAWSIPKKLLFFMDASHPEQYAQIVPMDRVRKYGIEQDYFSGSTSKSSQNISKIYLNMTLNDNTTVSLPMYSEQIDGVFEKIRLAERTRHLMEKIAKTFTHDRVAQ